VVPALRRLHGGARDTGCQRRYPLGVAAEAAAGSSPTWNACVCACCVFPLRGGPDA